MNYGKWPLEYEQYVRDNADKLTLAQMAEHLGKSKLAIKLFMHRRQIVVGHTVKRNLAQEILRLRFRYPEDFAPNRRFYQTVGINQMRWWDIYNGRKPVTPEEYQALTEYFGITLEEAFNAQQLTIPFNPEES